MAAGTHKAIIEIDAKVAGADAKLKKLERQVDKLTNKVKKTEKANVAASGAVDQMSAAMGKLNTLLGLGGFAAVATTAIAKFDQIQERTAKVDTVFKNLAVDIDKAKGATMGLVDSYTLAQQANNAVALGAAKTSDEFAEIAEIGSKLALSVGGDATKGVEDFTLALSRSSPQILDNLGISLKLSEAHDRYAATLGKTAAELTDVEKKQAFLNAAMAEGRKRADEVNVDLEATATRWIQIKVAILDTTDALLTHRDELRAVKEAETQLDLAQAHATATAKDQLLSMIPVLNMWADHRQTLIRNVESQNELNKVIRQAVGTLDTKVTAVDQVRSAFFNLDDTIRNSVFGTLDRLRVKTGENAIGLSNMFLAIEAGNRIIAEQAEKNKRDFALNKSGLKTQKDFFGNESLAFGPGGVLLAEDKEKKGGRGGGGKKAAVGPGSRFAKSGAQAGLEGLDLGNFQDEQRADVLEKEIELMRVHHEMSVQGAATEAEIHAVRMEAINETFEAEIRLAELRGDSQQSEILGLEKSLALRTEEGRHAQALAKATVKADAEVLQKKRATSAAAVQLANSTTAALDMAAARGGESAHAFALMAAAAKGMMAMATGAQTVAAGVASMASQNYAQGIMEIGAGILNIAVGGMLLAGDIPGAAGKAGGASAGGGAAMSPSSGFGDSKTFRSGPSSNIPSSPSGSPPAGTQGGGQSGGSNTYNVTVNQTGAIDDDSAIKIKQALEEVDYSRGKVSA